jgi:hypothetical protein
MDFISFLDNAQVCLQLSKREYVFIFEEISLEELPNQFNKLDKHNRLCISI